MRDKTVPALWDASDEKDFDKELQKAREEIEARKLSGSLNDEEPLTFEKKLERVKKDQTVRFESSGKVIKPLMLGEEKDDLVVNAGLVSIARLVTGQASVSFQHFASGTGTAIERPSDVVLANENFRVNMISSGFATAAGTVMKFVGKFPSFIPSALVTEGGVFSLGTSNSGIMLTRTLLPVTSRIEHITGHTFYSLQQTINQVSIT